MCIPRLSDQCYIFFFLFFKGWIGALKNVAGFGLAEGGARRARALLLSCAVRSAGPGGPARPPARPLVRPRSLVLPPPPPPLHGRARPAPRRVPSPPARVPGERWSGVGPGACLPRPPPSPGVLLKGGGRRGRGRGRIAAAARPSPAGTATLRPASEGARAPTLLAPRTGGRFPGWSRGRRSQ